MSFTAQTLTRAFKDRVHHTPRKIAFKRKVNGVWEEITFQEYYDLVQNLCFALMESGIEKGDRVAILSSSRVEWAISDLAILSCGAVTVPIYQSNVPQEVEFILSDSSARAIFVENEVQLNKVLSVKERLPQLKEIVVYELKESPKNLSSFVPLEKFCQKGLHKKDQNPKIFDQLLDEAKPDDLATIVYTSGTTGVPKGVMLSHSNFISELSDLTKAFQLSESDTILSFLPYAHILARIEHLLGIAFGWTTAFAESVPKLVDNLSEIKPTFMFAVPRIYEKVYNKIISDISEASPLKKKIFYGCLNIGKTVSQHKQKRLPIPPLLGIQYRIAKRLVFNKLNQKFGGKIRFFVSGGAPLSRDIAEFFHAAGFLILEGYGLTETTAAAFNNREEDYEFGTVGSPLGDVQVKIADDGEILLKSEKVFKGYFKNSEATKESFKDGWFCTGDIGFLNERRHLKITDRKKDIIVTSGGKNVAPQKIESLLKTERFISQVMVYGDKRNYLTALVTLNEEEIRKFLKSKTGAEPADPYADPSVEKLILSIIEEKNRSLPSFETIKKFKILKNDFTIEGGELTPSLKVRRKFCAEKYRDVISSMYVNNSTHP